MMKDPDRILYLESQQLRQWWIWLIVLVGPLTLLFNIMQVIRDGVASGAVIYGLILAGLLFGIGLPVFIYSICLLIEVRASGLYIRVRPLHRNWVVFNFQDICNVEAVTYRPIRDYGGWGIRYGWQGKAYNMRGDKGVMLVLNNVDNVLIGSQYHEKLGSVIGARLS